ncbi:bifunctional 3-(3-hydroxy-phenyl)propionate/3-hydroxycinnamic acid hydroxylase [Jiella sp. M17.18]|uniref:bifunctional 3-(3-hydroxy-phenyl)propionate/3-hydroxycinnamic acid hydroxylase MhpA n=1 Tax=Jiella sp. M17.18 TaxID=3234247 RepID=UPI0034DEA106
MQTTADASSHYDVLVAGFGPAGAFAAGLLGAKDYRTLVVDRSTTVYDKPRAIAIDHEILRLFDNLGLAEKVLPYTAPFTASKHFGAKGQLIRQIDMVPEPYPLSYTPSMVFTQPPVEAAMRDHAASFPSVEIRLGTELVDFTQDNRQVSARIATAEGETATVTADWLIGCDGAWSTVRQHAGLALEDLVFDEPWLVVDVRAGESGLAKLPDTAAQFCDPARPTSFLICPGNHRRWEIMLLPGENPREMEKPENVWKLLAPWLTPEDGELWRAAAYRFHALVADRWREGRVFIAGDAAHQQPPFIGQGMCQGLRDVSNLVWKLDAVMRKGAPERLLDSYGTERKRHVTELTAKIKAIGETICIRDPEEAAKRDAKILAEGGGRPRVITRQEIVPPLSVGLLSQVETPARGTLFPQPMVVKDGKVLRMDKVAGTGWRLVIDGRGGPAPSGLVAGFAADRLTTVRLATTGETCDGETAITERDDVLAGWFDRHQVAAAIVRPDHYVFGTARDRASLDMLVGELGHALGCAA